MLYRVRKNENFPDSKIFVARTFRIKCVNCINFHIRDKYALKVCLQILSITMIQICFMRCIYKRSRSPRHIFRSSRLSLEYPDTFFTSSGNFPVHPDTLYIIWIFCIVSGHVPKYLDILQPIMSFLQKLSGFGKTFRSALLTR